MPKRKKEIAALIRQAGAEKVTVLDLTNCPLPEFIDQICQMTQLEDLNLTHCHLSQLPAQFGNLTNLKKLSLRENNLATLPETIIQLTRLEYLDLTLSGVKAISEPVKTWLLKIPTHIISHTDLEKEFAQPVFVKPPHPNDLLELLQLALNRYGDALSAEDRNYNGDPMRVEADQDITRIFNNVPELKIVLADFYQDFQNHVFYYSSSDSEKRLKQNPFKLPTEEDDHWISFHRDDRDRLESYALSAKTTESNQAIRFIGPKHETIICQQSYGEMIISNQPYAADECYFADYAARLYRAGAQLFYLELREAGFGGDFFKWYVSQDSGQSWSQTPDFLLEFFDQEKYQWLRLAEVGQWQK